jgi:hypothetical protein
LRGETAPLAVEPHLPMLRIRDFHRDRHQLFFEYEADGLRFTNALWYHDCDLRGLERQYGERVLRNVYFHIGAFEVNKLASLGASQVSFGPFADLVTPAFAEVWTEVVQRVWAQWRFENGRPDWRPPEIVDPPGESPGPVGVRAGDRPYLSFCGGGKDSLVSARLLEQAGAGYDAFVYASSTYGDCARQHALVDGLVAHLTPGTVRRLTIFDDFMPSPVLALHPELHVRTLTAAETPASVFEALPVVLEHGYRHLVLGHERSADVGNLVWARTGEDVNHQWGKSAEAEHLLARHLVEELVGDCSLFSILKPVHDPVIFGLLSSEPFEVVTATHSCNVDKPWCRRCAKCVYVWLSGLAYLDAGEVAAWFGDDLFRLDETAAMVRGLAGLGEHRPFECVGEVGETRLALERCRAKGLAGPVLAEIPPMSPADRDAAVHRFLEVDDGYAGLPREIRGAVLAAQRSAAERLRRESFATEES